MQSPLEDTDKLPPSMLGRGPASHGSVIGARIGFRTRLYASAIDFGVLSVAIVASFSLVAHLAILGRSSRLIDFLAFILGLLTLIAPALYFWLLTWRTGQTLGKRIVGIAVVNKDGQTLLLGQSFLREVITKFLFNLLGIAMPLWYLGFLWVGLDKWKQGWHDKIADTYVVKASSLLHIARTSGLPRDKREIVSRILIGATALLAVLLFWALTANYRAGAKELENMPGERPFSVSEPLDKRFVELGDSGQASKKEWQRLLQVNHGRASMVPLTSVDPAKDLLVFIPGIGVNFQDAHAMAWLEDRYQIVIGIYNQRNPLDLNGQQMSEAIEQLGIYLVDLAAAQGLKPKQELRIVGHSLGGLVATLALVNLAERERIGTGTESLFSDVTFVEIDAPWRGFDVPWVFTLPGVKHVIREILPRLPLPSPATRSALSVVNRTSSMNAVLDARLPTSVSVHLVSVLPEPETLRTRSAEPVDGWYSMELSHGELDSIRTFLSSNNEGLNLLDRWRWGFFLRKQGLQQLFMTLQRDEDHLIHETELRSVVSESYTWNQFKTSYDAVIAKIVDTFQGQHTHFMWEDKEFLPWLRTKLEHGK